MAQAAKNKGGKNRKIGRNKKHQAVLYLNADRLHTNKKRAMRRHLRNHPSDIAGIAYYEQNFTAFDRDDLLSHGRKLLRRAA